MKWYSRRKHVVGHSEVKNAGLNRIANIRNRFGWWAIGGEWSSKDNDATVPAIHRASDLGIDPMDTASGYGDGHSEMLIARAIRERAQRCDVASEVGRGYDEPRRS